jgi:hypothetical protein
MRYCVFYLFILITWNFKAQITIIENDFPSSNDTIRFSVTTNVIGDYTTSGNNVLWDFSGLIPDSQYVKKYNPITQSSILVFSTFGSFAPTKYRATYSNENNDLPLDQLSQFLPVPISEINSYSRSISDSITALGYSITSNGQVIPFKSDTIETKFKFPLTFGHSYNSRGYTYVDFNPIADFKFKQYRKRISNVDAEGTLITPFGTFDALRIKHEIEEIDSVYQTFLGAGFWFGVPKTISAEYEWYTNGRKDALLKIVALNVNGNNQVQSVEYQDIYRNLSSSLVEIENQISIYPSLVEESLNVTSPVKILNFEVVDLNGKTELKGVPIDKNESINVCDLNSGMYFLRLKTSLGTSSFRFIKQ